MDPAFDPDLAFAAVIQTLRASDVPMETAADRRPNFYARPVSVTSVIPFSQSSVWSTVCYLGGQNGWVTIANQFVATVQGSLSTSGVEFRIQRNGRTMGSVSMTAGVDTFKDAATAYPVRWRPFYLGLLEQDRVTIQARKTSVGSASLLVGFTGFRYPDKNAGEPGGMRSLRAAGSESIL